MNNNFKALGENDLRNVQGGFLIKRTGKNYSAVPDFATQTGLTLKDGYSYEYYEEIDDNTGDSTGKKFRTLEEAQEKTKFRKNVILEEDIKLLKSFGRIGLKPPWNE